MENIKERAAMAQYEAFCRIRYFALRPLNQEGQQHLFQVADAAHNIPLMVENLTKDDNESYAALSLTIEELDVLLREPYGLASKKYVISD